MAKKTDPNEKKAGALPPSMSRARRKREAAAAQAKGKPTTGPATTPAAE